MQIIILFFIFLILINLSLSFFPLWNIKNSAINLMPKEYNRELFYTLFDKVIDKYHIQLNRTIRIDNNNHQITANHYNLYKNPLDDQGKTKFSDIESVYILGNQLLVCPKGSFHPYLYHYCDNYDIKIPENFKDNGDWELKCKQDGDFIIVYYLNSNNKYYQYKINDDTIDYKYEKRISDGFYDFKWTNIIRDSQKIVIAILKEKMNYY